MAGGNGMVVIGMNGVARGGGDRDWEEGRGSVCVWVIQPSLFPKSPPIPQNQTTNKVITCDYRERGWWIRVRRGLGRRSSHQSYAMGSFQLLEQ